MAHLTPLPLVLASMAISLTTGLTTCPGFPGFCSESFPGQSCNVVCDFGRNNVPLCQDDGTWTDIPRCIEHDPGVEEQIPGTCPSIPGYCAQGFLNTRCKFDCVTGADIDSICTQDGTWAPYPTCDGDLRETKDGCDGCPGPSGGSRNRTAEAIVSRNTVSDRRVPKIIGSNGGRKNIPSFAGNINIGRLNPAEKPATQNRFNQPRPAPRTTPAPANEQSQLTPNQQRLRDQILRQKQQKAQAIANIVNADNRPAPRATPAPTQPPTTRRNIPTRPPQQQFANNQNFQTNFNQRTQQPQQQFAQQPQRQFAQQPQRQPQQQFAQQPQRQQPQQQFAQQPQRQQPQQQFAQQPQQSFNQGLNSFRPGNEASQPLSLFDQIKNKINQGNAREAQQARQQPQQPQQQTFQQPQRPQSIQQPQQSFQPQQTFQQQPQQNFQAQPSSASSFGVFEQVNLADRVGGPNPSPNPPPARRAQRPQPQQDGFFGVFPEVNLQS